MQISVFKALADHTRHTITTKLCKSKECMCVCELVPVVGKDQSTIYRHIVTLEKEGLIRVQKEGRKLMCCATSKARQLLEEK